MRNLVGPALASVVKRKGDRVRLGRVVGFKFSTDEAWVVWQGRAPLAVPEPYDELEEVEA